MKAFESLRLIESTSDRLGDEVGFFLVSHCIGRAGYPVSEDLVNSRVYPRTGNERARHQELPRSCTQFNLLDPGA